MASTHIRDILTAFNPSLDFFAITTGDGRIKIWDTLKGQLQTEFADITSTHQTNIFDKQGHLSVDYTCIKWLSFQTKRKRKHSSSLLVLGTGSGDVLALDVSAGQLSWKINDCHPGGVRAISSLANGSSFYTAGADGMICMIDFTTGNLLKKFKASSKAVSCISVSPDGKKVATAAAQLKIFNCSDEKKIQKFSGHPGSVRCMVFTEDGKYILSSAVGERNVAVWRLDGPKKQSASCVLATEHPAVFLDSRCIDNGEHDEAGICVLAISEIGLCYIWFGNSIDELRTAKPTKISLSLDAISTKNYKGALPAIYAAKLQSTQKPSSGQVFLVYGMLVKPSFQNILVHSGTDVKLSVSRDGVLLPMSQSLVKSKKRTDVHRVTALDRANAEDALLPVPKVFDSHEQEQAFQNSLGKDVMDDLLTSGTADSMEIDASVTEMLIEFIRKNFEPPFYRHVLTTADPILGEKIANNVRLSDHTSILTFSVMRGLREKIDKLIGLQPGELDKAQRQLAHLYKDQKRTILDTKSPVPVSSSSFLQEQVMVVPHRFEGFFNAKGKKNMLCTRNLVPGEALYGEKLIHVQNEDGTEVEYRVCDPRRSKLGAAILGGVTNIWIKPGSRVMYVGKVCRLTVSDLSDLVGLDGLVYVVGNSDDVTHMEGKRPNVVTIIENDYHYGHYRMVLGMVDSVFGEIDYRLPKKVYLDGRFIVNNVHDYLKTGGHYMICTKVDNMNSKDHIIFHSGDINRGFKLLQTVPLDLVEGAYFIDIGGYRMQPE